MNVEKLTPCPLSREAFHLSREKFVPERSGCYVLTTFAGVILYIGLAKALRRRMHEHLNSSEKTNTTAFGRAVLFYWLESDELQKVERTWLNIHLENEGFLPVLNKIYSPTSG
jgi:hypothetical protein